MNTNCKLPKLYLHQLYSNRFEDFITNSQEVQKILHNTTDYKPNIIERTFTEKLTKNPEEGNMEAIKELICQDNGARNLIIAPTGSGKTYSIDAIFRQLSAESDGKQLLCLLCPNRVQNIQNEKSDNYNFEALIEGISLEDNGEDTRQISAVYDKLPEIRRYRKEHPDCKLRIVIDECHTLISANTFRERAVGSIMKLIQSGEADSYTFITATYENMCCFAFDNIMLFEDVNYKPVFKSIDIRFAAKSDFDNLIMTTALKESKPFIRLNEKERIKRLDKTLSKMGLNCQTVTADDKGYRTNNDGTVTYNNVIFDHIVNNDDLYNNEGDADIIFATSLLDAGTNFTKYSPESTPVFVICGENHMNIDEIEQSFNRFRPQKDENGNVIQLDHAVILHQIPDHNITRVRIATHDSNGKSYPKKTIPPMAVSYTDKTTPKEKREGYYNGILTIPGKYLEDLESGKYVIEFSLGNNNKSVLTSNLYVNFEQVADRSQINSLNEIWQGKIMNALQNDEELDQASRTIALDAANDALALMEIISQKERGDTDSVLSFFSYNTGDEEVRCQLSLRPFEYFFDIPDTLAFRKHEADIQYKMFYKYYEAQQLGLLGDESFDTVGGITEKELLESTLNMMQSGDKSNTGISRAMYITENLRLVIDYNKLFNIAYTAYQKQYFYYPERLADELYRRLNVPVSVSFPTPENHKIEKAEKEDRKSLLDSLNAFYANPLTRDILCDVLHNDRKIPLSLEEGQRKMLSEIMQSSLYKKEYMSLRKIPIMTFDYIVRALNNCASESGTNKYIRKLKCMLNNQYIMKGEETPFRDKGVQMQLTEQKTLISLVNDRKHAKGEKEIKNLSLSEPAVEKLRGEYNRRMKKILPAYTPKGVKKFNELLESVYIIINRNISSRDPELTELILDIKDVPFR